MSTYKKIVSFLALTIAVCVNAQEVGFFFLKDKKLTALEALHQPLETLSIEENPFWTVDSFQEYRCLTYEFKLNTEAAAAIPLVEDVRGVPFVVRGSGKTVYLGALFSFFSNEVFSNPVVNVTFPPANNKIWKLHRAYPHDGFSQGTDPRAMPEFMEELRIRGTLIEECSVQQ